MKTDNSRTIFLGIMSGPTGCDDSLLTSLSELVGTEARREANGRMRRQQGALQQILLVFGDPKYRLPAQVEIQLSVGTREYLHWNSSTYFEVSAEPIFRSVYSTILLGGFSTVVDTYM
jgi:hypothetical protein